MMLLLLLMMMMGVLVGPTVVFDNKSFPEFIPRSCSS